MHILHLVSDNIEKKNISCNCPHPWVMWHLVTQMFHTLPTIRSHMLPSCGDKPERLWQNGSPSHNHSINSPASSAPQQDVQLSQTIKKRRNPQHVVTLGSITDNSTLVCTSQPHPRMHMGSLPLPSPSGRWHPVGHELWCLHVVQSRE